ncbi:phosphotransferase family protein [Ilumatobacter sp.]|uniref:phosphotransferase family protein n=1 Tax=Ilumatobacter sp. TaxID=1967498 RepID=UPI003C4B3CC2
MDEVTIPDTPDGIDAQWLNNALTGWPEITSVEHDDIGEGTGIFGQISRLDVGYAGDAGSSPSRMVVKMACLEPENLAIANALGIYERELRFYEELASTMPFRIPASYLVQRGGDGRFVLIIEDLAGDFVVGDQVVGATPAQADAVVDALVPFHVQWWEHPDLESMDWLPVPNAPEYRAAVPGIYRAGLPVLEAEWTDRVSPEALAAARAVEPRFEDLMDRTSTGPRTIIHTDTRLDNVLFASDGSNEVAVIDFQLALRGRAVADIAYLIGTSMTIEDGAAHWERLLRRWHEAVTDTGIDYEWDDCVLHYKEAAMYYLSGAMSLIGTFDAGNERGAAMVYAYSTRILEHVADIGATAEL